MKQVGKVISSDHEQALIQVMRQAACGGDCGKCGSSCSMGFLISVPNTAHVKPGELVDIESNTRHILGTAALFYVIPLVFIVLSIMATKWLSPVDMPNSHSDLIAIGMGVLLYAISLFLIHLVDRKRKITYIIHPR